jgi:hypothetical protein
VNFSYPQRKNRKKYVIQNITFDHQIKTMNFSTIKTLLLILVSLSVYGLSAQEWFPDDGFLYDRTNIARVDITIDQDSLDMILAPGNEESDHEFPAIFTFKRGATTSTIDSIGFRLRGNTSRGSQKKSFKVSLNTFIPGQKYHEVEKINLNGEHNDPSIARAHICWDLFRKAGVPASRSGYSELFINNENKGLYINVEHIDEEFVKSRFGGKTGNLYKCLWPADLNYLGADPDLYKFKPSDRQTYELKTNLTSNNYSDLALLIEILHETDPVDFPQHLEPIFNVNTYLKNLVVEVLAGHWDAYSYNKNNFYLYHNLTTGKFEFIPYDPDNTLGISWMDTDWAERDIYDWSSDWEDRPLTEKVLQNQIYRDRFSFYMKRFLDEEFNATRLHAIIDNIRTEIGAYAEHDNYRTLDYGYNYADFRNSFDEALGGHVKYGIKPYITSRNSSALNQLDVNEIAPAITIASINKPHIAEDLEISALVEDELAVSDVTAWFSENGGEFTELAMANSSGDMFAATYPGLGAAGYVSFYIEATDQQTNTTREPPFGTYTVDFGLVSTPPARSIPQFDISVYPNPAHNNFEVDARVVADNYLYKLYSFSGQIVQSGSASSQHFTVPLNEHITDGIYYLEVGFELNGSIRHQSHMKVIIHR